MLGDDPFRSPGGEVTMRRTSRMAHAAQSAPSVALALLGGSFASAAAPGLALLSSTLAGATIATLALPWIADHRIRRRPDLAPAFPRRMAKVWSQRVAGIALGWLVVVALLA